MAQTSGSSIDKQKYLRIAQSEGVNAAITALHLETAQIEYQTFEGQEGWQPEAWKQLEEVRNFSRELWQLALTGPAGNPGGPKQSG